MVGVCRTAIALVALMGIASAQPLPSDPRPLDGDPRSTGGGPKVPVTLRSGGEVLGGDLVAPVSPPGLVSPEPPLSIEHPIDPATYVCGPGDVFELDFWGSQNL